MADRKEVFDYLRNRQKAAEIEAKVNGINLWVLIGAIALVAWQLLGNLDEQLWREPEAILRALLFTEGLYMLGSWGGSVHEIQAGVPYSRWRPSETESPLLVLFLGILLVLPPALTFVLVGSSGGAIVLGFFGAASAITGIVVLCLRLNGKETNSEKFPKPRLQPTIRSRVISSLIFGFALIFAIAEQAIFAWEHRGPNILNIVKQLALIAALYILVIQSVRRMIRSNKIAWTYDLETALLLGDVSTDVALRRIEHRTLASHLQDMMDRFFDGMDCRIKVMESAFDDCRAKLALVKDVALEDGAARASRIKHATQSLSAQVDALSSECAEFSDYLKKLDGENTGTRRAILAPRLAGLKSRYEQYAKRVREAEIELDSLVAGASTLRPAMIRLNEPTET